ncbi:MAG: ATP-binding protein [Rickettsiales bacterium]|nr:ATP-binding protein [Rickettsiales bacterium]MDG4545093.1 ATP-binding protein [Rickettsiales bacterium]MDG4547216.1 ATP-binding protein [Rickettsiales bacterium]
MVEIFQDRIEITNPGVPLIDTDRFLDSPPQSRNEILARFMRRINICEERGTGIDKVLFEIEKVQLPAPKFSVEQNHTRITIYAYKALTKMNKEEKIRACYWHACLCQESNQLMTNSSLRERFGIEQKNQAIVSRIISDTLKKGFIKPSDPDNTSRKHVKYIPFWA